MRSGSDGSDPLVRDLLAGGVTPATDEDETERVRRIATEADQAFRRLADVQRGVSIFGSAREEAAARWGELAREVGYELARAGFTVITGGGPGLMAAANEGALRGGGYSVGLTIHLPHQEPANGFLSLEVPFHYFFLRKLAFVKYSCAFVLLPGGYGTLDELFEALNLRRTHRLEPFPVILVGWAYWNGLLGWLGSQGIRGGTLSDGDLSSLKITDEPAGVVKEVVECHTTLCRTLELAP